MALEINDALRNMAVSHAIGLRRLTTGTVRDIIAILDEADDDLEAQIRKANPGTETSARLTQLLQALRYINREVYGKVESSLSAKLLDLALYEAEYQERSVAKVASIAMLEAPTPARLLAVVTSDPFQGRILREWAEGMEAGRYDRMRAAIRIGWLEGEGVDQIVRRLRGTKAMKYKDGILELSRRSAQAVVRTAVNHTSNAARQLVYEKNPDLLEGWRFVSTLESNTCPICAALDDGTVYPLGKGPQPPRHLNCRCAAAPVVKGGGATKRITFAKWFAEQSAEVQDDVLGPTRGKLYREGGLTLDKFADDNRVYTLDELKRREPLVMRSAS